MHTKEFSLSLRKRCAAKLRDTLNNAREIHEALPEGRQRRLFRSFVMLPLADWFTGGDQGDIPQPELRGALLACEEAYQGKRAIKPIISIRVRSVPGGLKCQTPTPI